MARRLAREEGLFAGFSAGANLAAALQLLEGAHRGASDRYFASRFRLEVLEYRSVADAPFFYPIPRPLPRIIREGELTLNVLAMQCAFNQTAQHDSINTIDLGT